MDISAMTDQELLKELLTRNNWTQVKLAEELGLKAHSHISAVINGKGGLRGSTRKLAEMLLQQTEQKE